MEHQVGGRGGVSGAVGGAEAEHELPQAEAVQHGTRKEGEGGEQHGGGTLHADGGDGG